MIGGYAASNKKQTVLPAGELNHSGSVHTKFYSWDWLMQSVFITK